MNLTAAQQQNESIKKNYQIWTQLVLGVFRTTRSKNHLDYIISDSELKKTGKPTNTQGQLTHPLCDLILEKTTNVYVVDQPQP